jgi:hypothetical protein
MQGFHVRLRVASLVFISSLLLPLAALAAPSPEGLWQGTLQGMLRVVLHVGRDSTGALTATFDSVDQGAMGMRIDTIAVAGDSLRFEMRALRAGFAGRVEAGGDSVTGQWRQGGFNLPLGLRRGGKVTELRRPQEPKPPYPYRAEEVSYENVKDGVKLAGTLTSPSTGGPFPAVLLITGSGPEDRDEKIFSHRPFLVLADHLTRKGIAVLRVDDRGVGGSTGSQRNATSDDFSNDVLAGVAFLKSRKDIDSKHIGLIGHSEGGMIAPMAATRSRDIAFIVLMAGPGVPGDSLLLLQDAALLEAAGVSASSIASQRAAMRRVLARVRGGADSAAIYRATRDMVEAQLAGLPAEQRANMGTADTIAVAAVRIYLSPWMRFFVGFDPRPSLVRVQVPVLAINGGRDLQVPPAENLAAIRTALEQAHNHDATVKELPGLNHLFQRCSTCTIAEYGQIEETIAPEALEAMSEWITAHTTAKR